MVSFGVENGCVEGGVRGDNTEHGEESAARVMLSEKRAASFQRELNCSKEESIRLLLRLKNMIDAKVHSSFFFFFLLNFFLKFSSNTILI